MPREFLQVLRLVPQYLFYHGVAFVVSRVLADTPGLDAGDGGGQGGAGGRGARRQRPVHDGRWRRWKGDETATILDGGKWENDQNIGLRLMPKISQQIKPRLWDVDLELRYTAKIVLSPFSWQDQPLQTEFGIYNRVVMHFRRLRLKFC